MKTVIIPDDRATMDILTRAVQKEIHCLFETMNRCDLNDTFQANIYRMAEDQLNLLQNICQQLAEESGVMNLLAH
ncbi:hypothetical protein SAMN04487897_13110 [Paenibacillus sp. yr247]|uniref:hypothetical protein n=1 Tax=Paenibacillus sp. yr247 TaxID=1761880 RepID=UPI0008899C01|nr:hypothetical protein [Paenibacillus sp. yr247]SDP01893.1 hypothetical protein SAMN04487897_13110 [Paenibacillus sp. yr247]